jgi:DNA-directed RNA polymerase specialized sigma24 family protein
MGPALSPADRVASLQGAWLAWLRVHHRALGEQHRDLVQESAADLLEWQARQPQPIADEDLRRVGFRVLQRRVADAFRRQVKDWSLGMQPEGIDTLAVAAGPIGLAPDPADVLQQERLLRALIEILTELTPEERALVVGEELGDANAEPTPRSDAQRKRLSRLRQRIRDRLKDRQGTGGL